MMIQLPSGSYKNISATGNVTTTAGYMTGFYVNNTSTGVIVFRDGGSSGTVIDGQITPAIGWHFYPVGYPKGILHMTLVSGSIDITVIFNPTS